MDKKRFLQILSDHSDADELKGYDEIENLINHYEVAANLKGFTKNQIPVTCVRILAY